MAPEKITVEFLDAFAQAFNRHDVPAILAAMTPDCSSRRAPGRVCGRRYEGRARSARPSPRSSRRFGRPSGAAPGHFSRGDRGLSRVDVHRDPGGRDPGWRSPAATSSRSGMARSP